MKPNITVRMTAANWDVHVRSADGSLVRFNLRAMDRKERSNFHREFMNAFRSAQA